MTTQTFNFTRLSMDFKIHRKNHNLTLQAAADQIGVNKAMAHRMEHCKQSDIQIGTFLKFCSWMNKSPKFYFE